MAAIRPTSAGRPSRIWQSVIIAAKLTAGGAMVAAMPPPEGVAPLLLAVGQLLHFPAVFRQDGLAVHALGVDHLDPLLLELAGLLRHRLHQRVAGRHHLPAAGLEGGEAGTGIV